MLIAEFLLRKTRGESALPVYRELCARYPSLRKLSEASVPALERMLRPLGLHRVRAHALKKMATVLRAEHLGRVPRDLGLLSELPHLGRYGANAVLVFAFDEPRPLVDANVARIWSRHFGLEAPVELHKAEDLWALSEVLVPAQQPKEFWSGVLDLGALICTPWKPRCGDCPLTRTCYGRG